MPDFTLRQGRGALIVHVSGIDVARYVVAEEAPAFEGPKPYLHPLRTLSGAVLTGFRPWDHRWHKGLQLTLTDVSGQNFWGGNTYVPGRGYVALDNVGRIRHDRFTTTSEGEEAVVEETLTWIARAGADLLGERRTHRFHSVDEARGLWALDLSSTLRNVSDRALVLGSPTTNGRADAGYSGAFLRLARSFSGGEVTAPAPQGAVSLAGGDADALMGARTPWLAFSGLHDEVDGGATVLAIAGRSSGAPDIRWFVRSQPVPVLAPSPTFSETVALEPGGELALAHRFVFLDRVWTTGEIAALADEFALRG